MIDSDIGASPIYEINKSTNVFYEANISHGEQHFLRPDQFEVWVIHSAKKNSRKLDSNEYSINDEVDKKTRIQLINYKTIEENQLQIILTEPIYQELSLKNQTILSLEQSETALDKLTRICIGLKEKINHCFEFPIGVAKITWSQFLELFQNAQQAAQQAGNMAEEAEQAKLQTVVALEATLVEKEKAELASQHATAASLQAIQAKNQALEARDDVVNHQIPEVEKRLSQAIDLKVSKVDGKGLSTQDYTTVEKNKLSGIASGAQVNMVQSVAGRTGAIVLSKADIGLANVDNTSDLNKPISTAVQSQLNQKPYKPLMTPEGQALTWLGETWGTIEVEKDGGPIKIAPSTDLNNLSGVGRYVWDVQSKLQNAPKSIENYNAECCILIKGSGDQFAGGPLCSVDLLITPNGVFRKTSLNNVWIKNELTYQFLLQNQNDLQEYDIINVSGSVNLPTPKNCMTRTLRFAGKTPPTLVGKLAFRNGLESFTDYGDVNFISLFYSQADQTWIVVDILATNIGVAP